MGHYDIGQFVEIVSQGLRFPTVILLDAIDLALKRYSDLSDPFWDGLRSLATVHCGGNLAFVLASDELPTQLAARRIGPGPSFFNIFAYVVSLTFWREEHARKLIANSPIPFPQTDVDWIILQSGCWPNLLQVLCLERLMALEEGDASDAWRKDALRQIKPYQHLISGSGSDSEETGKADQKCEVK